MKRSSLMELTKRHVEHVDSMARSEETLDALHLKLCKNYDYFFGPLRPKRSSVPSDKLRQSLIVSRILRLVEARRHEIRAAERHEWISACDSAKCGPFYD